MKRFCKEGTWGVIEHRTREQKRERARGRRIQARGDRKMGEKSWGEDLIKTKNIGKKIRKPGACKLIKTKIRAM